MDLANAIAKGKDANGDMVEYNGLEECFVQAGRMRELVECFALTSKLMLILKAEGRAWKASKKDRMGRDLGMFEIGSGGGHASVVGEE
jgi:nuclear pore complex protein Nup107